MDLLGQTHDRKSARSDILVRYRFGCFVKVFEHRTTGLRMHWSILNTKT